MFKRLLAVALLVPLVDAVVIAYVAVEWIGWVSTVLLVVLTGFVGVLLVQSEGRHTLQRLQQSVARGDIPTNELLDGAFLIAAGAFLLTPGYVTDLLGFAFALPLTRYPLREALKRWVVTPYLDKQMDGLVSGKVYTVGFPGNGSPDGEPNGPGAGFGPGGPGGSDGPTGPGGIGQQNDARGTDDDVMDVDPDAYEIDLGDPQDDAAEE